jgi:hypothetical protein
MKRLFRPLLRRFRRDEDGNAPIEFVLWFPVYLMILFASVEAGLMAMRTAIFHHSVDLVVRDLRLGNIANPTHDDLKTRICSRPLGLPNCHANLRIELTPLNTTTWAMPAGQAPCVDRSLAVQPVVSVDPGARNRPVLMRVCGIFDAVFPSTAYGMQLGLDAGGGYRLEVVSAFVNQPR